MTDHFESTSPIERVQYHTHDGVNSPKLTSSSLSFAQGGSSVSANGTTEITCGFRPSLIKIKAWYGQANAGYSDGAAYDTTAANHRYFQRYYDGTYWYNATGTSYIVIAPDNVGNTRINGAITAIGATSFTITWTNYISGVINYTWEAYK